MIDYESLGENYLNKQQREQLKRLGRLQEKRNEQFVGKYSEIIYRFCIPSEYVDGKKTRNGSLIIIPSIKKESKGDLGQKGQVVELDRERRQTFSLRGVLEREIRRYVNTIDWEYGIEISTEYQFLNVYWINQVQSILVFYGDNSTISVYVDSRQGQDG